MIARAKIRHKKDIYIEYENDRIFHYEENNHIFTASMGLLMLRYSKQLSFICEMSQIYHVHVWFPYGNTVNDYRENKIIVYKVYER